ncbi:unnamed protein product, partial [Rotaria sordida]
FKNRSLRCFKCIRSQYSPVCLFLSLLGIILLGSGIAAMLVVLIGSSTTTITATTTSETATSETATSETATSETTTSETATSETATITTATNSK